MKTPLVDGMGEIERIYNVCVKFRSSNIKGHTLTGHFETEMLDGILSSIALAMDRTIRRQGQMIIVY